HTFTELEKERIHVEMLQIAHRYFIDKGLKNTSIEDITSSVGIAKSSFYVFFESKEILYLELLALEGEGIEKRVWPEVDKAEDIHAAIKTYLYAMSSELESNILTQRLITDLEEYKMVSRKVNPQYVGSKMLRSIVPLMEFIRSRLESKEIIEADVEVIAGVMRAALLIGVHKKDVGEEVYPKVQEILFNAIARELTM
ncbi:TetR/AcrR family transcriptional regulator, partial [Anaerosolibacter sp.]|uniref:TetR/AcrR family transcriptional regulator n=1 Tax=Anaerosolibacter sp. TaxID=1872527 RepID=UPI0039F11B6E